MKSSPSLLLLGLVLSVAGCSAIIEPDPSLLGGDGGGAADGGPRVMLMDSGPGRDGGPITGDDGGPVMGDDGGPVGCMPGPATCDGEVRVSCEGGTVRRTVCSDMDAYCDDSGDSAECRSRECDPGASRCDGTRLFTCDARGTAETEMDCPFGCVGASPSAACADMPMICPGVEVLTPGVHRFNLCGQGDDETYTPMEGCGARARANGDDLVFAITLPAMTTISLDLRDDDGSASIDTLLYIRSACEDMASQVACGDDVSCMSSDIMSGCMSGYQVRQSRVRVTLPAGTYYVVVDSFNYSVSGGPTFGCGNVRLSYSVLTATPAG